MARKRKNKKNKPQKMPITGTFSHKQSHADRKIEKRAKRNFEAAISRVVKDQIPVKLSDYWTWGWVTSKNLFICPVIINQGMFPVGIGVWTEERFVEAKVRADITINEKIPLNQDQTPYHYKIGEELDLSIYGKSALHMFRQSLKTFQMGDIEDVAESEFRTSMVFIDPPLMKIDDEILVAMAKQGKLRLTSCIEDWDLDSIVSWKPEEA